ncbi:MAG: adenosylcobinamide-GDP ribazoletransferase, partial [Ornithinimicrobium sp.]
VAAHVVARWSSVLLMTWLPYAGAESANQVLTQGVTRPRLLQSSVVAAGALALVAVLAWPVALVAAPIAVIVTALAGLWFRRAFGGITGDCLGAANVIVEVCVLVGAVALAQLAI